MTHIRSKESLVSQVENQLQESKIQIAGTSERHNIIERMQKHKAPGVSITIVNGGEIAWSKDYGEMQSESSTQRLFQAGSISKPIAAAVVLALAEGRQVGGQFIKLNLDQDVNELLTSWKIPPSEHTAVEKVTLRRVLSHTAGLSVHGFGGYPSSLDAKRLPSNSQILKGGGIYLSALPELETKQLPQYANSYVLIMNPSPSKLMKVDKEGGLTKVDMSKENITAVEIILKSQKSIILSTKQMDDLIASGKYTPEKYPIAANSPVESIATPGEKLIYSGGGFQVLQQIITDVTGMEFSAVAREVLFSPLEMHSSGFELNFPRSKTIEVAKTCDPDGKLVEGGWQQYPQSAAAGLWSTSSDLARYIIGVQKAFHGEQESVISEAMAKEMLSLQKNSIHGLGPILNAKSEQFEFFHSGMNNGYNAYFVGFPETKQGAVVMTNSNTGLDLIREIIPSIAEAYDWPSTSNFCNKTLHKVELENPSSIYKSYAGEFKLKLNDTQSINVQLISNNDKLFLRIPQPTPHDEYKLLELTPGKVTPDSQICFYSLDLNLEIFSPDDNINLIKIGSIEAKRIPVTSTAQLALLAGVPLGESQPSLTASPEQKQSSKDIGTDVTDEQMVRSAFGRGSHTAKKPMR